MTISRESHACFLYSGHPDTKVCMVALKIYVHIARKKNICEEVGMVEQSSLGP